MRLFHSRREWIVFAAGALLGALLAGGAASAYFLRDTLRAYTAEFTMPKYAAHNCQESAPPLRDGAQAWLTNPRPAPNGFTSLCARLVIHGDPIPNAAVRCELAYTTRTGQRIGPNSMCGTTLAGADGIAQIGFGIGDPAIDQPFDLGVSISPGAGLPQAYPAGATPEPYRTHVTFVYSLQPLGYPPP